ncbi:MAG: dihydroorotate dehydrogenase electron transfer subunit [Tuberibacillus sp.]
MMRQEQMTIVTNREIAKHIYEIRLSGELIKDIQSPGQFVHIKTGNEMDTLLRRPISICAVDAKNNEMALIYRAEGAGTKKLAAASRGAAVDVLGPLGNGFPLDEIKPGEKALIVGGGVGVPPLFELSKQLTAKGVEVTHILGFSDASVLFYEDEFRQLGATYIATADGSIGTKGFVTDVIDNIKPEYHAMFACGPVPMLRALEHNYKDKPLYLSLEERMGCGIGACFACVCHTPDDPTGSSYRKVCTDGPVFKAGEVVLG